MKRLLIFILLFLSCWAQGQITANSPKAKIRVESVTLCPGQTADVAVYVDFGEYATKEGARAMENFMFFLYLTDTSVCEIVTSSSRHEKSAGCDYWVCEPVLKDMHPNIKCCMQNSYLYGTGWQTDLERSKYPKGGRFATTWFASESWAFMLTDSIPLFRIRIRCKKEGTCGLEFCDYRQITFSTGLPFLGGQYFNFNGGITNGEVNARPGQGPEKGNVDAGRDSILCVGSRLTLNGEGGTDYKWTEISGKASQQSQFLVGSKTKNPTFTPQQAGTYIFQMAAYAPNGCSTLDTVVYTVGENNLTQASISPDWNFIDPGSSMIFKVETEAPASSYPLSVTFSPDSLFAENQNVFAMTQGEPLYVASMPMDEPNLVAAVFEDRYGCRKEVSSSVFVKGTHITGHLGSFPVYRCGNDNSDKSIQLNVLTKGGSGKFNYKWTATDVEGNVAPPVIDDPIARSPRLTYQGLCAVSVSVYDLVTGENVLISDTMIYRDWLHPSVEVVVDTEASGLVPGAPVGPFCDGKNLAFKLKTLYPGEEPVYQWRINGITQEDSTGETFWAVLNRDDSIDVIMYSDEECVAEHTVQSPLLGVNVRYPVYMSASVVNSSSADEPYMDICYDSVKYRVLTWNAGTDYTLTWWRNGKDVICEEKVHVDNEEHSEVDMVLPRVGFYDNYVCAVSKSSMPCAIFDSITTESAYLNHAYTAASYPDGSDPDEYVFNMSFEAELLPIQMRFAHQTTCEGTPITVTTDVLHLPRDFTLIWFKKPKDGGDSVFLGYYRYDLEDEDNNFYDGYVPKEIEDNNNNQDYDLAYILGYTGKDSRMAGIRDVVEGGFRIVLNDPSLKTFGNWACPQLNEGFDAGDTLYYVLYTPGNECGNTDFRRYRSENFVPNLIKSADYRDYTLSLNKVGAERNCPTAPMVVVASLSNKDGLDLPEELKPLVHYEWRYDGRYWINDRTFYLNPLLESDNLPEFSVIGAQKDTLYVTHSPSDVKITCRAVLDLACGVWGGNKFKSFDFENHVIVGAPNFSLEHTETDTVVCAGDEVRLWAATYELGKTYKNKRKAARALAEYEYAWSTDWASLPKEENAVRDKETDTVLGMYNSSVRVVTPAVAELPDYIDDWNGVDGLTTYYLSVHHKNGDCWAYDSVRIFSAPDRKWDVSLDFTKKEMWCDSVMSGPEAQKIYLTSEDDPKVTYSWYLNGRRQFDWKGDTICVAGMRMSDTILISVYSDLISCRAYNQKVKMGIPYHESPMDVLALATPEKAGVGERVMIDAGAVYAGMDGSHEQDYVLNATYRWEKQERDGSWTAVPASAHGISDPTFNVDSMSVVVTDYMPRYRVIAEGLHQLCPADTGIVEIPVAVPTHVSLDVVDIEGGAPIFGMCSQNDDYVKITGTQGNTGTIKDTLFDVVSANKVRVRAFAQNPGAESWVMYYRNGKPYAAGPVGSARPNPRLPEQSKVSYAILSDGAYCDMELGEGDVVYVMYSTDTISADGIYTHYSSRYGMWRLESNGQLQLVSDDQVICPGSEVTLRAYFEDEEELYGHIDKDQALDWTPAEALKGTPTGWTAVGVPAKETLYKTRAVDGMKCKWEDSLRIYPMQEGEAFSLPFKLSSPDSVFCGNEVQTSVIAYIPDNNKPLSNTYSDIKYYVCDASGVVQASVEGFDMVTLPMVVKDGWRVYATARFNATCNTALSYSDTVVFRSVAYPVIERVSPRSDDTAVCMSHALVMEYRQPEGCTFIWHSVLAPMWGGETSLQRAYRVDRNTEVVFEAYRNELPSCRFLDTVEVEVLSGGLSGQPSLSLASSAVVSCGQDDTVTYTLTKRNCDTLIWYVNGVEAARDVLSIKLLPRLSGLTGAPDTVQVYGSRAASVCSEYANTWSNEVIVRRLEKPVITYITPDTTVVQDSTLMLVAAATVFDGEPASYLWIKGEDEEVSEQASFSFKVTEPAIYRVVVYQEAAVKLSETCLSMAKVEVSMKPGGGGGGGGGGGDDPDPIRPLPLLPDLSLSSSTQWLCGEGEVTYTLSAVAGYDTLVWFENGLEIARGDMLRIQRTPAFTGFDRADTVFVRGVAVDSLTSNRDTIRYKNSNSVYVHRIEKPVFESISPRDTLVEASAGVTLTALATSPDGPEIVYYWSDSLGDETGEGATFTVYPEKTQFYYVTAEQYSTKTFECYAEDSVRVQVKPADTGDSIVILMGEIELYIPNTVMPYSHKVENTYLRVYGLNIKQVHLQVFNDRSEKLYDVTGDAENTRWDATGTDGRHVPSGTYSYRATVTVVDNSGGEHIIHKQSWVQVIL